MRASIHCLMQVLQAVLAWVQLCVNGDSGKSSMAKSSAQATHVLVLEPLVGEAESDIWLSDRAIEYVK